MSYDPYRYANIVVERLYGYGVLRPEPLPPADPFDVEYRWIVAADGRTYREFATGSTA